MSQQLNNEEGPIFVVLFVVFGLFIGALLREVNKRTKFPYTPQLLAVGLFLGYFSDAFGQLGEGTVIVANINPHLLLLIFIPVLIFQSGFNCDWYIFRRSLVNILVLAGPGVLWGAILLGFSIKFLLGYSDEEITWYQAFTLGSVLSATDPVAVVALLKELGASTRFNTLIEGQSLLNDGTAMVFYKLFADMVKGRTSTPGAVGLSFLRIAIGGPVLGIIVGVIAAFVMKRIIRDQVLTTCVTFLACFISFYLAQFSGLGVSGILSLVVLGLYLSAMGKTNIYPQSEHSLHVVWSFVQYACETIIFLLTGVIIGVKILQEHSITSADWIKMILFWFLMQVMRLVMVGTFTPVLNNFGYPLSNKEFVVLVYGGLRGALGLSLALMVYVDNQLQNERFKELTLFYMSGMASLTLLINGTTCGPLVKYIQMIEVPPIRDKLYQNCKIKLAKQVNEQFQQEEANRNLAMANWKKVKSLCFVNKPRRQDSLNEYSGLRPQQIFQELRYRILREFKRIIWERYQEGRCSERAARILEEACDRMLDSPRERLAFWELIKDNFSVKMLKYMQMIHAKLNFIRADRAVVSHIYDIYDTCLNLMLISEQINELFGALPIREQYIKKILEELQTDSNNAENYLTQLQLAYPNIIRLVHTRMASLEILIFKKNRLNQYLEEGYIDLPQYKSERNQLDKIALKMDEQEVQSEQPTLHELTTQCPILSPLTHQQMSSVVSNSIEKKVSKNQKLLLAGGELQHIYLIKSGSVKESIGEERKICGAGQLVSLINLISTQGSLTTLTTFSQCSLLQIKASVLLQIMRDNSVFEGRVFKACLSSAVKVNPQSTMKSWRQSRVRKIGLNSVVLKLKKGQVIALQFGGFLLEGSLACEVFSRPSGSVRESFYGRDSVVTQEGRIGSFSDIPPQSNVTAIQSSSVLAFSQLQGDKGKAHISID